VRVALAVAVLIVGLCMLGLAAGFGVGAVRRIRARESVPMPETTPDTPVRETDTPPYAMWTGAGISAALGLVALVTAAAVLVAAMDAPAHLLRTPATAGGLRRDDSAGTRLLVGRQRQRLKEGGLPNPVTAVYRRPGDSGTTVLFIGSSGQIGAPEDRLREFLTGMAESTGTADRRTYPHPAGRLKGAVLCLDRLTAGPIVLTTCGWADGGTLGVITSDDGDASRTASLLLA
jgi:hypothetical protein